MSPVPAREALEAMKRVDIQKLCKDYGVKANLKTEALIDLLLDASQPQHPRHIPVPPPQRSTSIRVTSRSGSRPRGQSSGSVIIHDTDDDEQEQVDEPAVEPPIEEKPAPSPPAPQPPRTRKAKDTQYRLGVGRPILAGGSGARAVTKSVSVSRGAAKRVRPSRSTKPQEATIAEEEPEANVVEISQPIERLENSTPGPSSPQAPLGATASRVVISTTVAEALSPVQKDIANYRSELNELKEKVASVVEAFEVKIRELSNEIASLRQKASRVDALEAQVSALNKAGEYARRMPVPPSTPKRVGSPRGTSVLGGPFVEMIGPSELSSASSDPGEVINPNDRSASLQASDHTGPLLPSFPSTTLGKRPRESVASNLTGFFELGQEDDLPEKELEKRVARPAHKRAKLVDGPIDVEGLEDRGEGSSTVLQRPSAKDEPNDDDDRQLIPARLPNFTIFSGPDERSESSIDPPPPTVSLPDFYGPPSPPMMSAPATSTANAAENQNPFTFSFLPISSTPAQAVYPLTMGSFPYPEPPTSPSPANNVERPGSRHSERFNPFGSSSGSSARAASGGSGSGAQAETSGSGAVNPASLGRGRPPQREPSSNEVASGLGLTAIRTGAVESSPVAPPAKRTMYGTELEGDTRFGDFGVEGVASGFWTGGRF
ncbi:hypothetical protein BV22DRAFT_1027891 [Leucogyrophana mollusca]|uniref:Uncharacterized protein n=1 Tax=Leucogyrophana mollusca TaxID=85980 RepID=A0ACB8C1K7_9AGAM|nr:hypothetical protein BV22DRAFT_1027891 [Leucogyrophana mollusca]